MLTRRIFDGAISMPAEQPLFHLYPNRLEGISAGVAMHAHPHDHLVVFDCSRPGVTYGIEAFLSDGTHVEIVTSEAAGLGVCALVRRGVRHRIWLKTGEWGAFCCIFSHYDEAGMFLPDPKLDSHE